MAGSPSSGPAPIMSRLSNYAKSPKVWAIGAPIAAVAALAAVIGLSGCPSEEASSSPATLIKHYRSKALKITADELAKNNTELLEANAQLLEDNKNVVQEKDSLEVGYIVRDLSRHNIAIKNARELRACLEDGGLGEEGVSAPVAGANSTNTFRLDYRFGTTEPAKNLAVISRGYTVGEGVTVLIDGSVPLSILDPALNFTQKTRPDGTLDHCFEGDIEEKDVESGPIKKKLVLTGYQEVSCSPYRATFEKAIAQGVDACEEAEEIEVVEPDSPFKSLFPNVLNLGATYLNGQIAKFESDPEDSEGVLIGEATVDCSPCIKLDRPWDEGWGLEGSMAGTYCLD